MTDNFQLKHREIQHVFHNDLQDKNTYMTVIQCVYVSHMYMYVIRRVYIIYSYTYRQERRKKKIQTCSGKFILLKYVGYHLYSDSDSPVSFYICPRHIANKDYRQDNLQHHHLSSLLPVAIFYLHFDRRNCTVANFIVITVQRQMYDNRRVS